RADKSYCTAVDLGGSSRLGQRNVQQAGRQLSAQRLGQTGAFCPLPKVGRNRRTITDAHSGRSRRREKKWKVGIWAPTLTENERGAWRRISPGTSGYLSVQDKGAAKSAKRALAAPFSDFQSLIILAVDPTQSLRGPTSICRPFSQRRESILRDSVSFFRPCPVLDRHSCRSESQHPRCIPGLWDWPFPPLSSCQRLFL